MADPFYCAACGKFEVPDAHWRALLIRPDGSMRVSAAAIDPADPAYKYQDVRFACGQGSALVLIERYLHSGSFEAAQPSTTSTPEPEGALSL